MGGLCGKKEQRPEAAERLERLNGMLRPKRISGLGMKKSWTERVHDMSLAVEARTGRASFGIRYKRLPRRLSDDYTVEEEHVLGTGFNGSVFLGRGRRSGTKYAVKSFRFLTTNHDLLEAEVEIFLSLDHPHVARLLDVYEDETHIHMVMECMDGGELLDRLRARQRYTDEQSKHAIWQILLAVNYLHGRKIVHKDLKLQNFLYQSPEPSETLKLIDFGFSQVWVQSDKEMNRCVGTLAYSAPEVLKQRYTSQCDLWSIGVILFVLLVGHMPFGGDETAMTEAIGSGKMKWHAASWKDVHDDSIDLVKSLLRVDPDARPTAQQALEHKWFSSLNQRESKGGIDSPMSKREQRENLAAWGEVAGALCNYTKASQFRRACMLMMAWSLSDEERMKLSDLFYEADQTRQGTITLPELQTRLQEKFRVPDDHVRPIFNALDVSENNEILYSEFLAAMVSTGTVGMHDDLMQAAFRRLDVDNSGFITVENLKDVFGDSFGGAEVAQLIEQGDLTKDGQISREEFIEFLKEEGPLFRASDWHRQDSKKETPEKVREVLQMVDQALLVEPTMSNEPEVARIIMSI